MKSAEGSVPFRCTASRAVAATLKGTKASRESLAHSSEMLCAFMCSAPGVIHALGVCDRCRPSRLGASRSVDHRHRPLDGPRDRNSIPADVWPKKTPDAMTASVVDDLELFAYSKTRNTFSSPPLRELHWNPRRDGLPIPREAPVGRHGNPGHQGQPAPRDHPGTLAKLGKSQSASSQGTTRRARTTRRAASSPWPRADAEGRCA